MCNLSSNYTAKLENLLQQKSQYNLLINKVLVLYGYIDYIVGLYYYL